VEEKSCPLQWGKGGRLQRDGVERRRSCDRVAWPWAAVASLGDEELALRWGVESDFGGGYEKGIKGPKQRSGQSTYSKLEKMNRERTGVMRT